MTKCGRKKGSIPWNKDLTKETDERVRKYSKKVGWSKDLTKETDKRVKNQSESLKGKSSPNKGKKLGSMSEEGKKNIKEAMNRPEVKEKLSKAHLGQTPWNKDKKHSEETIHKLEEGSARRWAKSENRKKARLNMIKFIENNVNHGGQVTPFYNSMGCKLINEYGKENGYNFQHAENGGEFRIEELGYWVDGYDKENNVVIEIDESNHYDFDGKLKTKDVERQKEIEDFLKCKFIRLKI